MAVKKADLPNLIRQTRKFAGLSQKELAELAGVGKTLIFDLEKGHEKISFENLVRVLTVLNIQVEFTPPEPLRHTFLDRTDTAVKGETDGHS